MDDSRIGDVAVGDGTADLVVRGGSVFSPETRELLDRDVAVADGHVAALPEDAAGVVGPDTTVLEADGRVVAPGLIDAHTHLDLHQAFEQAYHRALSAGTTAVVSEVAAFGPAFGAAGVEQLLAATADLPVRVHVTVPPQPLFDAFEPPRADEAGAAALADLLDRERVVGVGETTWTRIVGRETPARRLYDRATAAGKPVTGHGAGCDGANLQAFATVVDDDHEAITGDGIRERVENGIHAVGRYGSIRDDVAAVADAVDDVDPGELSLSTDGMWPRELVDEGYMDAVLSRAVEAGVDPMDALKAATLSPARHYDLDGLGTLSPGSVADLVLIDDLESFSVSTTVVGGDIRYDERRGIDPPREAPSHEYPEWFTDYVDAPTDPEVFHVPTDRAADGTVRGIDYDGGLLSMETTLDPDRRDGALVSAPDRDVLKAALLDRHPDADGDGFVGFVTGFGFDRGAVATTLTWETPAVLAVGVDDADLRSAVERINDLNGGWAVVDDGDVLAELPTPVGGVVADVPVEETADRYGEVDAALRELGSDVDRPMLGLQTLSFFGVPALKLSFSGYADVMHQAIVGLTPDSG